MQRLKKICLVLVCVCLSALVNADDFIPNPNTGGDATSDDLTLIANYLRRLGSYMGYDLTADSAEGSPPEDSLLTYLSANKENQENNSLGQQIFQQTAFVTLLGAIPVNASSDEMKNFVPASSKDISEINKQANFTFTNYDKENPDSISIVPGIDHTEYAKDPGTQSVLNILSTEDQSFCDQNTDTSVSSKCLSTDMIMNNLLADMVDDKQLLPGSLQLYTQKLSGLAGKLNSNTLMAPMMYNTEAAHTDSSENNKGLPSKTQAAQAGSFIRYMISGLNSSAFVDSKTYSDIWLMAYPNNEAKLSSNTQIRTDQLKAQQSLAGYLASLRVFAAQGSIAINNLYGILSRRMPQSSTDSSGNKSNTSSQALSEYQLASWRIYDATHNEQWMDQLNKASAATVQKEIAVLLSEINYQLYLSRQQDEKILLTNTIQLLQALSASPPALESLSQTTTDSGGSS